MDKQQAKNLILEHIPATGEIDYTLVWNASQTSPEGRAAIQYFHALRRSGEISVRVNRENGGLLVSRPVAPAVPAAPAPRGQVG